MPIRKSIICPPVHACGLVGQLVSGPVKAGVEPFADFAHLMRGAVGRRHALRLVGDCCAPMTSQGVAVEHPAAGIAAGTFKPLPPTAELRGRIAQDDAGIADGQGVPGEIIIRLDGDGQCAEPVWLVLMRAKLISELCDWIAA